MCWRICGEQRKIYTILQETKASSPLHISTGMKMTDVLIGIWRDSATEHQSLGEDVRLLIEGLHIWDTPTWAGFYQRGFNDMTEWRISNTGRCVPQAALWGNVMQARRGWGGFVKIFVKKKQKTWTRWVAFLFLCRMVHIQQDWRESSDQYHLLAIYKIWFLLKKKKGWVTRQHLNLQSKTLLKLPAHLYLGPPGGPQPVIMIFRRPVMMSAMSPFTYLPVH